MERALLYLTLSRRSSPHSLRPRRFLALRLLSVGPETAQCSDDDKHAELVCTSCPNPAAISRPAIDDSENAL